MRVDMHSGFFIRGFLFISGFNILEHVSRICFKPQRLFGKCDTGGDCHVERSASILETRARILGAESKHPDDL
jgi:hypothetical protein